MGGPAVGEKVQASGSKEGGERLSNGAQGGGAVEGRGGVRQGAPHHLHHRLQDYSDKGLRPRGGEKCRWVVRNQNKQVEENVCTFVDKKECSNREVGCRICGEGGREGGVP